MPKNKVTTVDVGRKRKLIVATRTSGPTFARWWARVVKVGNGQVQARDAERATEAYRVGLDPDAWVHSVLDWPARTPGLPQAYEASSFSSERHGVVLVHGEGTTMVVPRELVARLVSACVAALSMEAGRW